MELSGVIALALVGLVSGTPYGYGVKSGAVAKAEANAASGAFGVLPAIPLSIPSGGGFSGSFSKSSSSSFASSSASSSSSSFSFSGTGANGIAGIGCQSTGCKNGANGAPSSWHGSTSNGLANSGALASAGAGAIAGSSTFGNGGNSLCKGNNCASSGNTGSNCAYGQCGPSTQTGNIPSGQGSLQDTSNNNDSKDNNVKYNQNGNYGGLQQTGSEGKCAQGKCGPGAESSEEDIFVPLGPSNDATSTHPKPSEHLSSPNFGPACTDHNCNQGSPGSYNDGKPLTSYNVPILGSNPSAPASNGYTIGPTPGSLHTNSPTNCAHGFCSPASGDQTPSGLSHSNYPSQPPSSISSGCSGSNCNNYGVNGNSPGLVHGTYHNNLPSNCENGLCGSASTIPTSGNQKPTGLSHGSYPSQPSPTISSGCLGSNCGAFAPSVPKIPPVSQSSNCNSFNCAEYAGATNDISGSNSQFDSSKSDIQTGSLGFSVPNSKPEPSPSHHTYPNHPSSSLKPNPAVVHPESKPVSGLPSETPTYTGGFGAPAGSINSGVQVSSPANRPDYSIQQPAPNQQAPSVNGGYTSSGSHNIGTPTSSLPSLKPNTGYITPNQNLPSHTSGFGHPTESKPGTSHGATYPDHISVSLTPNTVSSHEVPKTNGVDVNASFGIQATKPNPVTHTHDIPAYTGGFGTSAGPTQGNGYSKPSSGVLTPDKDKPVYTGSFGGSAGTFDTGFAVGSQLASKPNSAKAPSTSNLPHNSNFGATVHNTGVNVNSGSKYDFTHDHGILSKPSGSLVPPVENTPHGGSIAGPHGSHVTSHPTTVSKPADEEKKIPTYTGGFGGPGGLLKPHDYSLPTQPLTPHLNNENHCTTGACHPKTENKVTGDKQDYHSDTALAGASASANAKAIAYSGGFGGPPGLLKPFDDEKQYKNGKVDDNIGVRQPDHSVGSLNTHNENNVPSASLSSASNGAQGGSQANAGAQANAVSFAGSAAFGANQGGAKGCNTGCGSNPGIGGSFASSGSLGLSNAGLDALNNLAGASASSKSIAGASAGGLAVGRSFATSSASAHASAGASVKGGYGR